MFEYTHDQHFVIGHNGEDWREWTVPDDQFNVRYGRPNLVLDWRSANVRAAGLIGEATRGKRLGVAFSGGMDSQIVVLSLLEAGVEFDLYHYDLGNPESMMARLFASQHGLELNTTVLDPAKFFYEDSARFRIVPAVQSMYLIHCRLIEDIVAAGRIPVLGESFLTRKIGYAWCVGEGHRFKSTLRYMVARGIQGYPVFFNHTPEQISAFINSEWADRLLEDTLEPYTVFEGEIRPSTQQRSWKWTDIHTIKYYLYRSLYPEVRFIRKQIGVDHLRTTRFYADFVGDPDTRKHHPEYLVQRHKRFSFTRLEDLRKYFGGAEWIPAPLVRCHWFPTYPR